MIFRKITRPCLIKTLANRFSNEVKAVSRKKPSNIKVSSSNFQSEVTAAFKTIEDTLRPMLPQNPDFDLKVIPSKEIMLTVGSIERGAYTFVPDFTEEVMRVNAPFSGSYEYYYDSDTNNWLSVMDKHDMRGLITRDLLKHCIGCPLFP